MELFFNPLSAGWFHEEMCKCSQDCSQDVQRTRFGAHVLDFIDIKAIDMHIHICIFPPQKTVLNPTLSRVYVSGAVWAVPGGKLMW